MQTNSEPIPADPRADFRAFLEQVFDTPVLICGVPFNQVAVLEDQSPLTYLDMYFEWLKQEMIDGIYTTPDGGSTFYRTPIRTQIELKTASVIAMRSRKWGAVVKGQNSDI